MIFEQYKRIILRRGMPALLTVLVLAGCATATDLEVDLSQDFPSPLVVPAPVHMGIYIPAEFEQYVFQEFENIPQKRPKKKPKKKQAAEPKPEENAEAGEKKSEASANEDSNDALDASKTAESETSDVADAPEGTDAVDNPSASADKTTQTAENTKNSEQVEKESNKQSKPAVEKRLKMRVALGDAQSRMIRSVLPPVFENATLLESLAVQARPEGLDLYLVPEIKRLQYTTPQSTRTKVYEIWLQYDFVIYDRNDDVVTRWNLPCYGKTPSAMMKSQKDALQAATQMALRDCGAAFSTGFSVHPAVQRWMQGEEQRRQSVLGRAEGQ